MRYRLTAGALAELDQWAASGRNAVTNVVAAAVKHLDDGQSPAAVAHTVAASAYHSAPDQVASVFGWAIVALAEQARQQTAPAPVIEHGIHMVGGGMHVRFNTPEIERIFPLADWIRANQMDGGKVSFRTVIVVHNWREVPR